MDLECLIEMMATELKLPAIPEKDKNNCFQLQINPKLTIVLKELSQGIFIQSSIFPIPKKENQEALYIYLMKANLLGQGTGGATIGIDDKESFFILSQLLLLEVSYKTFYETLEDFLNYVQFWKEELPKLQTSLL